MSKPRSETTYCVYILLCTNGNYYTGYTNDLERRYSEHLSGSAKCKYTRSFKPLNIAQCWQISEGKNAALKIEHYLKKLSKNDKQQLILYPEKLAKLFQCKLVSNEELKKLNDAK